MRRFRWKKPWHYVILLSEGYLFGFGLANAIRHYPDSIWVLYAVLGIIGFTTWMMTDVFPAN